MSGTTISISAADGGSFGGYLAIPESGIGPGLILLQEIFGVNAHIRELADIYAEEGYLTLAPDLFWRMKPGVELGYSEEDFTTARGYAQRFDIDRAILDIGDAIKALRSHRGCTGKVGAIGFCLGGRLAYLAAARLPIDAAVGYYGVGIEAHLADAKAIKCPIALHFGAEDKFVPASARSAIKAALAENDDTEIYTYRGADHAFNNRSRENYHPPSASLAHSRSLALLRRAIGPRYDLDALWEKHLEGEFATCDPDATIRTMVPQAYVNHVPTMIGGHGARELYRYYKYHFIPQMQGSSLIPISRTIGADRVVDEFVVCIKHDRLNDTMLPGIEPTGKEFRVPLVVVVQFRGDKLYKEHIYWDQASVLAQIGVLNPAELPIAGAEQADKLLDAQSPLNTMRTDLWWKASEGKS